ncbi:MAG: glycosyltransferase family 2 protein [Ruminococcaceae bacterium]|nr:glycosyltransferase family 2 protein [Oscillospiraceae bacterium]
MKLSLVVPCFNEEENVQLFFDETQIAFEGLVGNYEIVFVNDGSTDNTRKNLKVIYENNPDKVQVLTFSRNFGKESAIFAGLSHAKGDLVCIIDADLQQRPEVVIEMLKAMSEDDSIDCVTAYQENRKESKFMTVVKSGFYKVINKIADVDFVNGASDFRLMKRNMVDAILDMGEYHRFSKGIFSWVGFNTKYIPYTVEERRFGKSKWNFIKLLKYAIEGIISFSTFPLKFVTGIGLATSFASVLYLLVVIFQKLIFGIDVPGYATIVVLVLFLGGIQLFCLGLLGEYLSKIYMQVKNRPIYVLKEHLGKDERKN